jgi:UDPglucose 6-dehydrogenase
MMRKPAWVFDSRSIVNPKKVLDANLKLWRIGDGSKISDI